MDKFVTKRARDMDESSHVVDSSHTCDANNENKKAKVEFNSDDIVSDPGLRKPIESFDVRLKDRVRREYISRGPCQPYDYNFPKTKCGRDNRSFQAIWFKKFPWLEYSVSKDAAFCFWCYLFKPSNGNRFGVDAFIKTGVRNWKGAIEKFNTHVGGVCSRHNKARIQLEGFNNQKQNVSDFFNKTTTTQSLTSVGRTQDWYACSKISF